MACTVELIALRKKGPFSRDSIRMLLEKLKGEGVVTITDRRAILSPRHLASGYLNAARALIDGRARAREPSLEVLRWLAGSHQVGEALDLIGPGGGTDEILISIAPSGWPTPSDREDPPVFARSSSRIGVDIEGVQDITSELDVEHFCSPQAPEMLGIDVTGLRDDRERELSLLEWLATTELR